MNRDSVRSEFDSGKCHHSFYDQWRDKYYCTSVLIFLLFDLSSLLYKGGFETIFKICLNCQKKSCICLQFCVSECVQLLFLIETKLICVFFKYCFYLTQKKLM